jgi:hypothetical protein
MVMKFANSAKRKYHTRLGSQSVEDISQSLWAIALPKLDKYDPTLAAESTFMWRVLSGAVSNLIQRKEFNLDHLTSQFDLSSDPVFEDTYSTSYGDVTSDRVAKMIMDGHSVTATRKSLNLTVKQMDAAFTQIRKSYE